MQKITKSEMRQAKKDSIQLISVFLINFDLSICHTFIFELVEQNIETNDYLF